MQVFLPFPNFAHSVSVLDRARLGKQRIECRQIMTALRAKRKDRVVAGWGNHPATLAWEGYESALGLYFTLSVTEWVKRGYNNTMIPPYDNVTWLRTTGEDDHLDLSALDVKMPPWLGDEDFHASHRSNLLRKDEEYYRQFGWNDPTDIEYIWPKP